MWPGLCSQVSRGAQLHLAKTPAEALLDQRDSVADMKTAVTHRPRTVQQSSQWEGITTISLEEQKIFSIDRLYHQLLCEHFVRLIAEGPN